MRCNLRSLDATPALFRSNYDLRRHTKFGVAELIHCRITAFLLLTHYFILYAVTLTSDPVT